VHDGAAIESVENRPTASGLGVTIDAEANEFAGWSCLPPLTQ
jgi:hypothetical protein